MADTEQLPDELTITLRKPIEFAGITYTTLQLREPTAAEWAQFDKLSGVEMDVKAVATISGVPEAAVKQIGTRDLIHAARFIARFLD